MGAHDRKWHAGGVSYRMTGEDIFPAERNTMSVLRIRCSLVPEILCAYTYKF